MIYRNHYRAQLKSGEAEQMKAASALCLQNINNLITEGKILSAGLYYYRNMLFLYYESVDFTDGPDSFMAPFADYLCTWPDCGKLTLWKKMRHIFYHSEPRDKESWMKDRKPEKKQGRIAFLKEDMLWEYVCSHTALVNEGLLVGDKYQSIALEDNLLFSFFEEPRTQVNIKEDYEHQSEVIKEWLAADPDSHFERLPEAKNSNFYILPSLFTV